MSRITNQQPPQAVRKAKNVISIRRRINAAGFFFMFGAALVTGGYDQARANLSFSNGATATPPTVKVPQPNPTVSVIPDTLTLVSGSNAGTWNQALTATLIAQGYTTTNGWYYSFPPPAPLTNPVSLGSTSNFNVTTYSLSVTPAQPGGQIAEPVQFTLSLGNTKSPAGATSHWLQLLNESQQYATKETNYKPFGYQINGLSGYWQLDNGDLPGGKAGVGPGPYYDSNGGPAYSTTFKDNPTVGSAWPGTYLHFLTIPTWDVNQGGKDYILVGNQAISWGYTVIPEPGAFWLMFSGGMTVLLTRRRRVA